MMQEKMLEASSVVRARDYYKQLNAVTAWRISGQSMRCFCQEHSLSYAKFKYWKQRARLLKPVAAYVEETAEAVEMEFVPVSLSELSKRAEEYGSGLALILRDGKQLWLPSGYKEEDLLRTLSLLEKISC